MFTKHQIIKVVVAFALLAAVTGSGIVADSLGLSVTAPAQACSNNGSSGGGC